MISHASMDAKIGTAWQRLLKRVFPESKLWYSSDPRDPAFSGYGAFASEIRGWIEQSRYILTVQTPQSFFSLTARFSNGIWSDLWSYYWRNLRTKILKPWNPLNLFPLSIHPNSVRINRHHSEHFVILVAGRLTSPPRLYLTSISSAHSFKKILPILVRNASTEPPFRNSLPKLFDS